MADQNVGSVVVLRDDVPWGIVTDRDLVLRVLRRGLDPVVTRVDAVASNPLVTARDDVEPMEAAVLMREHGIRRLPVVDGAGALVGIVSLDDLVHHVGRETEELSEVVSSFPVPYEGG
jgi:CBS domain-containing protein